LRPPRCACRRRHEHDAVEAVGVRNQRALGAELDDAVAPSGAICNCATPNNGSTPRAARRRDNPRTAPSIAEKRYAAVRTASFSGAGFVAGQFAPIVEIDFLEYAVLAQPGRETRAISTVATEKAGKRRLIKKISRLPNGSWHRSYEAYSPIGL